MCWIPIISAVLSISLVLIVAYLYRPSEKYVLFKNLGLFKGMSNGNGSFFYGFDTNEDGGKSLKYHQGSVLYRDRRRNE